MSFSTYRKGLMLNNLLPSRSFTKAKCIGGKCLAVTSGLQSSNIGVVPSPSTLMNHQGAFRFSSTTVVHISDPQPLHKSPLESARHCVTCTCDRDHLKDVNRQHTCHDEYVHRQISVPYTSPQPNFSYHRRVLPSSLTQLSSPGGKTLFRDSFLSHNAEAYFPLSEQFVNQSEPAYCAVASLIMVLNAFGIDPNIRWKGGWRWYGSEEMILGQCCINVERVRQVGILMEEFASLGQCQGLNITIKRPIPLDSNSTGEKFYNLNEFRRDLIQMVRNPPLYEASDRSIDSQSGGFLVVSFARKSLGQTGDGHYSPIAAYHEPTDQCLVLDVARFKYAPFWVSVKDLYEATRLKDSVNNKSRGWFLIYPSLSESAPSNGTTYPGSKTTDERKRPAHLVPSIEEARRETQTKTETCSARRI